jgi:putative nucleotidyltransferase with HDIG domain
MGLLGWIKTKLFPAPASVGVAAPQPAASARAPRERPQQGAQTGPHTPSSDAALPQRASASTAARAALLRARVGPLDGDEHLAGKLDNPESDLLERLRQRIESGELDIPLLPPTSVTALEVANRPSVDVHQLVQTIARDPLITSELLRIANSALYATQNEASSLQQAIMRIGLKAVRNVVFSAAMKSSLSNARRLNEYAEEVWRQSQSVAAVARKLGASTGFEREQAYLIGLLHDIGKIVLLGMLQREMRDMSRLSPALVGRTFRLFHESAGGAIAAQWKLPIEIVSVASQHHDFASNEDYPRAAALAKLAHEIDLRLSLRDEGGVRMLVESPALEFLGIRDEAARWQLIEAAREEWEAHAHSHPH